MYHFQLHSNLLLQGGPRDFKVPAECLLSNHNTVYPPSFLYAIPAGLALVVATLHDQVVISYSQVASWQSGGQLVVRRLAGWQLKSGCCFIVTKEMVTSLPPSGVSRGSLYSLLMRTAMMATKYVIDFFLHILLTAWPLHSICTKKRELIYLVTKLLFHIATSQPEEQVVKSSGRFIIFSH